MNPAPPATTATSCLPFFMSLRSFSPAKWISFRDGDALFPLSLCTLQQMAFELFGALLGGMAGHHPAPSRQAKAVPVLSDGEDDLLRRIGKNDFLTGREQLLDAGPDVRYDRRAACGRLKQTDRRRPASLPHLCARDIQRVARCRVEGAVFAGPQMLDPFDIAGPDDIRRILW